MYPIKTDVNIKYKNKGSNIYLCTYLGSGSLFLFK